MQLRLFLIVSAYFSGGNPYYDQNMRRPDLNSVSDRYDWIHHIRAIAHLLDRIPRL
jgi:hypothetical protein